MKLFGTHREKRNALIIKDHVIRYINATEPGLKKIANWQERFLPHGVIREGKIVDYDTLHQILLECVDEWKLGRQPVQFCVPDAFVVARKVALPGEVGEGEIRAYLYMELGQSIAVPFDNPVFDYEYNQNGHYASLLSAPSQHVEAYVGLLQSVKCKPNAADISALCFYRMLHKLESVISTNHTMLLEVDLQAVMVSIFYEDQPVFLSHIPLETEAGLWKFKRDRSNTYRPIWTGSKAELMAQAASIAAETDRIMSFYRYSIQEDRHGIDHIVVGGDHPYVKLWRDSLQDNVDIPVQLAGGTEHTEERKLPLAFYENAGLVLKENIR